MMKYIPICFLAILLCSCMNDMSKDTNEPPVELVNTNLLGIITDVFDNPLEDVFVTAGKQSMFTNADGLFSFRDIELNKNGAVVTFQKQDFNTALKFIETTANESSLIRVQLIEEKETGRFNSTNGGTVTANGNARLDFEPNSIVNSTGSPYTGEVIVNCYWFDPTFDKTFSQISGGNTASNLSGEFINFIPLNSIFARLSSPNGEELNLAPEATAELYLPAPASLDALPNYQYTGWSLNEETGIWEEENVSFIKEGGFFKADLPHFSFWSMFTSSYDLVNYQLEIKHINGDPAIGLYSSMTYQNYQYPTSGDAINSNGIVNGLMPLSTDLRNDIVNRNCNQNLFSQPITSTPVDITLSALTLPTPVLPSRLVKLQGTVVDCNGAPITNGIVHIIEPRIVLPIGSGGQVDLSFMTCNSTIDIEFLDITNASKSLVNSFTVNSQSNLINIGVESACNNLDEFIKINVDGEEFLLEDINFDSGGLSWVIPYTEEFFELGDISGLGINNAYITMNYCRNGPNDCLWLSCAMNTPCLEIDVTRYDPINTGYIEGTFGGPVEINYSTTVQLTGSFKVIHD